MIHMLKKFNHDNNVRIVNSNERYSHPVLTLLVKKSQISQSDAERVISELIKFREPIPIILRRLGLATSQEWATLIADNYGIQQAFADDMPDSPILNEVFTTGYLRQNWIIPLADESDSLLFGMADPCDERVIKAVRIAAKKEIKPVVVAIDLLEEIFAKFYDQGQFALQSIVNEIDELSPSEHENIDELIDQATEAPVVRLVNQILGDALKYGASDIHIEPDLNQLRVRYRVHGRMQTIKGPPSNLGISIISRIKIIAKLDIAERRMPQDGRCKIDIGSQNVDLRVATIPTIYGESIVIRLLDTSGTAANISKLGLTNKVLHTFEEHLHAPHGMILVTGPTGSGKTTTLYAGLKSMDPAADKIISIEDPIEYRISGVTQIQVKPEIDLDFSRILRAVVRHDPDTIMVGETRDGETANIAIHAALTGHLMLTTLHTNSAAGAIGRLLDMKVEPFLLASVLRLIVGQRLVGELCQACRVIASPSAVDIARLHRTGHAAAVDLPFYQPVGCKACNNLGFKGRIGIFEFLPVDETIRELIRTRATAQDIQAHAVSQGMDSMFHDGMEKAIAGRTSLAEVMRVTEEL